MAATNIHLRLKFNIKCDFFMTVLFSLFVGEALKIDIWWTWRKYAIWKAGNYKTIVEGRPAWPMREHKECLIAARWQSIFKERMNFLQGSFFLHASSSLIITIESFTRTRYPRVQQNSFSSPPGGGQSSPPGPSSSSFFPVHLVSLHSGAAIITLSFN